MKWVCKIMGLVLLLVMSGCGWHINNRPFNPVTGDLSGTHPLAEGCYAIEKNNQTYLTPARKWYAFKANQGTHPETGFYFQPVPASGSNYYVVDYDAAGKSAYLAVTSDGDIERQWAPSDATRWKVVGPEGQTQYPWKLLPAIQGSLPNDFIHVALVPHQNCLQRPEDPQGPLGVTDSHHRVPTKMMKPREAKIWGFADVHNHMFAHLGFGGALIPQPAASNNFSPEAFPACWDIHSFGHFVDYSELVGSPAQRTHGNSGFDDFEGFPKWYTMDHQQVYYRWLERAYYGGLRLLTVLAVNNEVLCEVLSATHTIAYPCDDMKAIKRQVQAAHDMEQFVDNLHGGRGKGWFRIVTNSHDARDAISKGQLAVVLGVEVSNLFGCTKRTCEKGDINGKLDELHSWDVRHLFLVHEFDNAFAGASMFHSELGMANYLATGRHFDAEDCSGETYNYQYNYPATILVRFASAALEVLRLNPLLPVQAAVFGTHYEPPSIGVARGVGLAWFGPFYSASAHCNRLGLTDLGKQLVQHAFERQMIVDVDHMSRKAVSDTIKQAENERYPLVSGHSKILSLKSYDPELHARTEFARTDQDIKRISALGGLVAPMLAGAVVEENIPLQEIKDFPERENPIVFDCNYSSQEWAQKYSYAVHVMRKEGAEPSVAFGSDFNGYTDHIGPRYSAVDGKGQKDACLKNKQPAPQLEEKKVGYPFDAVGISDEYGGKLSFQRLQTGTKIWDFNFDGLAHVGLLPDFIEDLQRVGLTKDDLVPLFQSAESYVSMWECIEDQPRRMAQGCQRKTPSLVNAMPDARQ